MPQARATAVDPVANFRGDFLGLGLGAGGEVGFALVGGTLLAAAVALELGLVFSAAGVAAALGLGLPLLAAETAGLGLLEEESVAETPFRRL